MHFNFHYTFNLTKLFWPPLLLRKTFWSPPLSGNSKLFWPPPPFCPAPHQNILWTLPKIGEKREQWQALNIHRHMGVLPFIIPWLVLIWFDTMTDHRSCTYRSLFSGKIPNMPAGSVGANPDSDSTLVDSDSDSDSTSVDSDSSVVDSDSDSDSTSVDSDSSDSDSGLMDSDSTQVDSDSQWVQVSPVRNVQGKFKLSCAIMDEIRGRN